MSERLRRFAIRVGAISAKEVLHILRDPRTLLLALVMPVVMLLLFGYGISFDLEKIPLAVADADRTPASRALVRAFAEAGEFEIVARVAPEEAEALFRRGKALAALVVRPGFGRDADRGGPARAALLVDGADAASASQVLQKADAIARAASLRQAAAGGAAPAIPIEARAWARYNPEARSAVFMVPGLTAYLMALGAVLLTALTVAGEWERGSMEQLFASPVGRFDIIFGKLLPYLALGMLQLLLVVAVGASAFDVPVRGPLALLFLVGLVFLVAMLGQGLFISVVTKNQLVATQAGTLSSLLPSLLLSGMLFPIENMPVALQAISRVIPARYLVHGLRGLLLKGNGLAELWPDLVAMALFAAFILAVATARFRRRIA
jgi:ABC-2 type transport system permease protein